MLKKLEKISSETIYSNPYWDYVYDKYIMPGGDTGEYHYVKSRGATMIIPVAKDGRFVMARQYRYLNARESLEFPGGGIRKGVLPGDNARCELEEETGLISGNMELIGQFNPYNGVTNEICYVYLAQKLQKGKPLPDSSEEFELVELNYNDIIYKIRQGEIWDGMTLASWAILTNSGFWEKIKDI